MVIYESKPLSPTALKVFAKAEVYEHKPAAIIFTFLENPGGFRLNISLLVPETLSAFFERKWLMITILPVVYGLMRYLQDIYEKHEGESPERVLLSDKPLLASVIIWAIMVVVLIYFVSPSSAF